MSDAVDYGAAAARPDNLASALAPFGAPAAAASRALEWLLVVGVAALLIALMCADSLGVGPRREIVRRRHGRTWKSRRWR